LSAFNTPIDLAQLVTISGVVVAAIVGLRQLSNLVANRQAQLFMQLYDRFSREEFLNEFIEVMALQWVDFEDYWQKYGLDNNRDATLKIHSVGNFFEGIGVLVKRRLIKIELVDDLMSGSIIRYWEKMMPVIIEQRKKFNWPQAYEWTEYLYNKIVVMNKSK
jgi:hypothetical protein